MENQYYQSCKLTFPKRKFTHRSTHTCSHSHTVCTPINHHTHFFTLGLYMDFCQVSDFVVTGWMFWTFESVTGTFPSPGVGALIMGVPVRKAVLLCGIFIQKTVLKDNFSILQPRPYFPTCLCQSD